jgi:hypothetical protein
MMSSLQSESLIFRTDPPFLSATAMADQLLQTPGAGFLAAKEEFWRRKLNMNLLAAVRLDRLLVPHMIKTRWAASQLALPAPAMGAPVHADPAFGLVETHKTAWARLLETENRTDDHEALEEAGRVIDAALGEVMKTPPMIRVGAHTVVEKLVEGDKGGSWETSGQCLATLLRSRLLAA